jgi:hypothetical protein
MISQSDLYNNEMICAISIYLVLLHLDYISISKALLIFPIISHQESVDFLKNNNTIVRSLEEFIIKKPNYFSNYNERFYSFLTLSVNSMMLLKEIRLIRFLNSQIVLDKDKMLNLEKEKIGQRAVSIAEAAPKLASILKQDEKNLYLQLRVRL